MVEVINQISRMLAVSRYISSGPGTAQQIQRLPQIIPAGHRRIVDTGRQLTQQLPARLRVVILNAEVL